MFNLIFRLIAFFVFVLIEVPALNKETWEEEIYQQFLLKNWKKEGSVETNEIIYARIGKRIVADTLIGEVYLEKRINNELSVKLFSFRLTLKQ